MNPTRDPDKAKHEQDVRDHITAFFAKGGKIYEAKDGESAYDLGEKGSPQEAFVITWRKE